MVRVRCLIPVLLVLVTAPLAGAPQGSTAPPRDLRLVQGHWTPYSPPDPATFPAGAQVHIIERGDTLWALAQQYYGNAYLWPQLWELNTYITDAHWIYPGDPLLVQGETVAASADLGPDMEFEPVATPDGVAASLQTPLASPIALGTDADILCFGYLGQVDEPLPNRVIAFEDAELKMLSHGDRSDVGVANGEIVFVDGNEATGLIPGETYLVVRPAELVEHPDTEEIIGQHYDYRGQMRILCMIDGRAVGYVTQSCAPISIGDRLKPMPLAPIPLSRPSAMANVCTPENGKPTGYIVNAKDYRENLGEGSLVEVNLGRQDFVEPGDFLTIYRYVPESDTRQILGEIGVLTAEETTATGRIITSRYNMRVGDRVEAK